jgi:hypothetical protein
MLVCPRCTTENAEGSAKCSYCAQVLMTSAPAAPMVGWAAPGAPPQWGMQPYVHPGMLTAPMAARDGNKLVVPHGAQLPNRCVKCNAPAEGYRLRRQLTWVHPAYLLLLFTGLIFYVIAARVAGKSAEVQIGLCPKHRRQRLQAIVGGWTLGLVGAIVMPWLAIAYQSGWIALVGAGMVLTGTVGGIVVARMVRASKIDDDQVWLSGIDRRYLDELSAGPPNG